MAPPNDDDHGCAFRDYAKHLEAKLASVQADLEVLKRAFARRSEKRGKKMPPVVRLPRTPEDSADRRGARALLRAERMATKEESVAVPAEMKQCSACADPRFRKVGGGKTCETYSYVPGYFRRTVHRLETLGCRCGATIVTAPAPKRWAENTRYDASFVAYLITTKCLASMPHYRLEQQLTRTGIPVARSTINDLFRRAAQKLSRLRPILVEAIRNDPIV